MSAEVAVAGQLDIGRILGETFGVIRRNAIAIAAPTVLFVVLPSLAVGVAAALSDSAQVAEDIQRLGNIPVSLLTIAAQAAILAVVVNEGRGRSPTPGAALAAGGRSFLPLLLLGIVAGLGVTLGLLLLIVPGLILACGWAVAGAALIAENKGVADALTRSWALTRSSRWPIFLVFLVVWLIAFVPVLVLGAILGFMEPVGETQTIPGAIVEALASAILVVGPTAVSGVLYVELLALREGVGPQSLAEVFS